MTSESGGRPSSQADDLLRQPASEDPYQWVASEATLVAMLVKHYQWTVVEPGLLRRFKTGNR